MRMHEALKIIKAPDKGYMVKFELKNGVMLEGDNFPDNHAGEDLIPTEEEAWALAARFAKKMVGKAVNIFVVDEHFRPVDGYRERYIKNR